MPKTRGRPPRRSSHRIRRSAAAPETWIQLGDTGAADVAVPSGALLHAVLGATADGVLAVDASGRIVGWNKQFLELWDVPDGVMAPDALQALEAHVQRQVVGGMPVFTRPDDQCASPGLDRRATVTCLDGRVVARTVRPQRVEAAVVGHVYAFRDVTMEQRLRAQLRRRTGLDLLTGLINRARFRYEVQAALRRAATPEQDVAVIVLDLDDFKRVNDGYGLAAGDALLGAVAVRLARATRGCDTVARLGADEFAVLLDCAGPSAHVVAERITTALAAPVLLDGGEVVVTASVGIAYGAARLSADGLLRNADVAMGHAKQQGKGRYALYSTALSASAERRLQLEGELRRAIERQEFVLHYQPIVRLENGTIVGAEALVRWLHPRRGTVPPSDFIPLLERTGLIVQVGRWVLVEACRQAVRWHALHPTFGVTVNVSGRQLEDPRFVRDVADALRCSGLPAGCLTLELTESLLVQRTDAALAILKALKALGVRLAVDDFGTGYSSLAYLDRFPLDVLKIDKSFTDAVGNGASSPVVASLVVSLGTSLALATIAEGIEEERQVGELRAMGCMFGQGYHFARPMPADALGARLAEAAGVVEDAPA